MFTGETSRDEIAADLLFIDPDDPRDTHECKLHGNWKEVNDKIIKLREFMAMWGYKEEV